MELIVELLAAFVVGGVVCALAQAFMMATKLAPPAVLVVFLVVGGVLSALGLADFFAALGTTGLTAMIVGCGQAVYNTTLVFAQGNPIPFATVMAVYLFLVVAGSAAGYIRSLAKDCSSEDS